MRRIFTLLIVLTLAGGAATAGAQQLDLAPYARVVASDTRETFFGLWPRETDDAAATVRDGSAQTSWKIPQWDRQTLRLDFAPLHRTPPTIARLSAQWATPPAARLTVRVRESCGGPVVAQTQWATRDGDLTLAEPATGYCLELVVENAGRAALSALHVFAEPSEHAPDLAELDWADAGTDLAISWVPDGEDVHHVEIHFVDAEGDEPSDETLIARHLGPETWHGPKPAASGRFAAVAPVAWDGARGEARYFAVPGRDEPTLADSGVVEGFYGRPWSHGERRAMMRYLARAGLGLYIYAPKDDPLHRDNWRELYDEAQLAEFADLLHLGRRIGVTFSYGISPGKSLDVDNPADLQALVDKLAPLVARGVRHITLLFDDIEGDIDRPVDGDLGAEHAATANFLHDQLAALAGEPVTLWFVPTVYSTSRQDQWAGGPDYLAEMADLADDIVLMWTGTGTSSATLAAADVADVTALTGRAPAIWENQHATDGGDGFWGRVYAAPFNGRDPDLVGAVTGIVANPMILGAADRLMLCTYGAFLRDPAGYDGDAQLDVCAALAADAPADQALARQMADTFFGYAGVSIFDEPIYPALEEAIDGVSATIEGDDLAATIEAFEPLLAIAAQMAVAPNDLHHSGLDTDLVDDLWYPAQRLLHDGHALLQLATFAGERLTGRDGADAFAAAGEALMVATFDRYQLSTLVPVVFKHHLGHVAIANLGFVAPPLAAPPAAATVGESWTYEASADTPVEAFGLPGAIAEDGVITWTPPHAGLYDAVVTAVGEGGWNHVAFRLVVRAPGGDDPADDDDDDDDTAIIDDDGDDDDDDAGCGC